MAGPSIGTWVKVRNKSGRMTARVIANKFGGGSYEQGQVITQSEYNAYKEKRAEAKSDGSLGWESKLKELQSVSNPPSKSSKKEKLSESFSKQFSKRSWSDAEIRKYSRMTPAEFIRKEYNNSALASDFEKYAQRSGLYWKDTRTGSSFQITRAMETDLLALDTAYKVMGKNPPELPGGSKKRKSK